MAFTVGQAQIKLVPSFAGFSEAVDAEAAKWGASAGKSFSDCFNETVKSQTNAPVGPSDEDSSKKGTSSGGAFADSFKTRVDAALKSLPNVPITADSSDADRKIADVRTQLTSLSSQRIGVDISDADALAKLTALKVSLDDIGKSSKSIQVKVDTGSAVAELGAVKTAADAASGAGGAGSGLSGLATAAFSLGPALVPIGATLVAGFGSLVPILLSAGTGIGAFALAASGDLKGLEADAQQTLTAFQKLTQSTVEPVIGDALKLLIPVFSTLVPLVDSAAGELDKLANSAKSALGDPFWQGFITFIDSQAGPAISSFATLFGGLAKAFAGTTQALSPLITGLEGDLDGLGVKLSSFGATAGSSSGFQNFLAFIQQEAPVVGQLILNVAGDIGSFVEDLAPLGAAVLAIVTPITGFANVLLSLHGPFGLNIVDVGAAALAFAKFGPLITSAASSLSNFYLELATAPAGAKGLQGIVEGLGGIGTAAALAAPVIAAVGFAFWQSGNQAAVGEAQAKAFLDGVTTEATATLPQITSKLADLKSKFDDLQSAYQNGKLGFDGLVDAGLSLQQSIKQTSDEQTNYNQNLDLLRGRLDLSTSSIEAMATSLNINLANGLSPAQVRQFTAALQEQAAQSGLTQAALESLAASASTSTADIAKQVTAATSTATSAWKSYGDAVSFFSTSTLPVSASDIAKFYTTQATQGAQFSSNIQKAIKDGYDPTLISNILQAGPAQASQLLQGLVDAQGTGLKNLIDQTTAALASEGAAAVEQARLTQEAISSKSNTMAAALPIALALSQDGVRTNAAAAIEQVATQFNLSLPAVTAIATEYGDQLPSNINAQLDAIKTAATNQVAGLVQTLQAHIDDSGLAGKNLATATVGGIQSVSFTAPGGAALQQLIDGMTEGGSTKSAKAAGAAVAAAANTAADALKASFATTGSDLTAGMAAGMISPTALAIIGRSAAEAVATAEASAKSAAKVSSPSKLFADEVGTYLTQGIAVGMIDSAALASLKTSTNTVIGGIKASFGGANAGSVILPSISSPSSSTPLADLGSPQALTQILGQYPIAAMALPRPINLSTLVPTGGGDVIRTGPVQHVENMNIYRPADADAMAKQLAFLASTRRL